MPHDSRLHHKAVFGPISLLYRFRHIDQAIEIVNQVDIGLQHSIFTKDFSTALKAFQIMESNADSINDIESEGWLVDMIIQL